LGVLVRAERPDGVGIVERLAVGVMLVVLVLVVGLVGVGVVVVYVGHRGIFADLADRGVRYAAANKQARTNASMNRHIARRPQDAWAATISKQNG
jgi:hypothetical protein